jgi:peroxiredoxin
MKKIMNAIALAAVVFAAANLCMGFMPADEKVVQNFSLKNVDGGMVSLNSYPDAKGFIVIFTCNHCPFAKLYPPRLNDLNDKYAKMGVPLIAISSTDTITYEEDVYGEMVKKARNEHFNFPYLFDGDQTVAKNFNAQKTPHAFVIWKEKGQWVVKYNGAIDDNGAEPENVENPFVARAVDALLAGQEIAVKETKSIGCKIIFRVK